MLNKGIIKKIDGNRMVIQLYKDSSCAHCSGCSGGNKFGKELEFETDLKGNIGDTVTFEIEAGKVFKSAMLAYIFPALSMIFGYLFGDKMLNFDENYSILTSFLFLGASFLVLFIYDKIVVQKKKNSDIKIISIAKDENSEIFKESCKKS